MSEVSERSDVRRPSRSRRLLFVVFAAIPLLLLVATTEISLRALDLDQPMLDTNPLPEELFGAIIPEAQLLWSGHLNASIRTTTLRGTMPITTNRLGPRGEEVQRKNENEFRILSLGERSTFWAYVNDGETYSARLQKILNRDSNATQFSVLNAGVSACSSFQSLLFVRRIEGRDHTNANRRAFARAKALPCSMPSSRCISQDIPWTTATSTMSIHVPSATLCWPGPSPIFCVGNR